MIEFSDQDVDGLWRIDRAEMKSLANPGVSPSFARAIEGAWKSGFYSALCAVNARTCEIKDLPDNEIPFLSPPE